MATLAGLADNGGPDATRVESCERERRWELPERRLVKCLCRLGQVWRLLSPGIERNERGTVFVMKHIESEVDDSSCIFTAPTPGYPSHAHQA